MDIELTINLDNFENIKLGFNGDSYEAILPEIKDVLENLGTYNEHSRTKIVAYAKRVFGFNLSTFIPKPVLPNNIKETTITKTEPIYTDNCSKCGKQITEIEVKASKMFMNVPLCRTCLSQ